jgi:hypothetical protein
MYGRVEPMVTAALIAFAALVTAWLLAPAERRA